MVSIVYRGSVSDPLKIQKKPCCTSKINTGIAIRYKYYFGGVPHQFLINRPVQVSDALAAELLQLTYVGEGGEIKHSFEEV